MEPNDLLGMSLDQLSHRGTRTNKSGSGGGGGGGGAWFADRQQGGGGGGARGRDGGGGGGMRSEVSRPQSVVAGGGTFRSAMASARAPQQYASSGSGPIRRAGIARGARESAAPYQQQRPARATESVFDRLGERERGERDGGFGFVTLLCLHPGAKSI